MIFTSRVLLRVAPVLVLTAPFLASAFNVAAGGAAAGGAAAGGAGANIFINLKALADTLLTLVNVLVPIAFTIALVFFFWGLARFLMGGAEDKETAKGIMIWGLIALFVMASVWGIVILIRGTLGVGTQTTITIPTAL